MNTLTKTVYTEGRRTNLKSGKTRWDTLEAKLQKALTENRYRHTLGVTYTACALAMVYGEDLDAARTAGLLHDCAKCIPNSEKISICKKKQLDVTEFELDHPVLLHAKLGVFVAQNEYGITDTGILDAIRWHTTGKPDMTLLEKIVFISDYIEPNRTKQPHLAEIRKTAFADIDLCLYMILKDTVEYLSENPKSMDTMTTSAYEYYKNVIESRG
ncbi:HD domain-containing protein [Lachnospiraceae bacterium Oil+RF-744-WCA-WT-13]|jgi:predicted HD superfamily hydrolase involved in NAD metabolism|uniref:bis(5'-nucleosyl)-tetraphosphatase (symmetrical) n=1 Tax=Bilifractor porci TaxID=2606636 RepID=A0A7X2P5Y8_9FIRM|nr:HD domain-containing protein [Bilifractor porci]